MDIELIKTYALLILLFPLAGAVLAGGLGRPLLREKSHWPVIAGGALAFLFALLLGGHVWSHSSGTTHGATELTANVPVYEWISCGATSAASKAWFWLRFQVDSLTVIMLTMVTFISTLVFIYSRDYMRDNDKPERGYERFFAFLALFLFSMCALVLAGNFILLYLGWEAVGLCSYLLIGFYYPKPEAAAAAKKAFLVNRIGDFGFGLGIFLIYKTFNAVDYETVFSMVSNHTTASGAMLTEGRCAAIALLLFCGAVGKSAQLPLHVWLPDAMEGPSPVSALIHAATMVTAGVYMVARCGVIFTQSHTVMMIVACVGGATALFSATIALTQTDMKRVLAYSTVSQLGYMFLGLGVFAASSAIFHLFTHAFFKALLFLGAGSVMHAMGGIIDMKRFGGLRKALPWTFLTFWIGSLALAGFPLLSGFWSKDEIIHHAFVQNKFLGFIGLFTAVLTAFYTFRMVFMAFHGPKRVPDGVHPHESGRYMLIPLLVLSAGAMLAGYVNVSVHGGGFLGFLEPGGAFEKFLHPAVAVFSEHHHEEAGSGHFMMYLSALLAIGGIVAAWYCYIKQPDIPVRIAKTFQPVYRVLYNKYYVDEIYDVVIVRPLKLIGQLCVAIDTYLIDGVLWIITQVPLLSGDVLRQTQRGSLQGYAVTMAGGLVILLLIALIAL